MERNEPRSVLILCTGNSCRSQMAEAIWNHLAAGKWKAVSAGSRPSGYVHELALVALEESGLPTAGLTSKSSDLFQATPFDLVVTVCDNARDACPTWPAARQLVHWPFPDPADATGTRDEQLQVFRNVRDQIQQRIGDWLAADTDQPR